MVLYIQTTPRGFADCNPSSNSRTDLHQTDGIECESGGTAIVQTAAKVVNTTASVVNTPKADGLKAAVTSWQELPYSFDELGNVYYRGENIGTIDEVDFGSVFVPIPFGGWPSFNLGPVNVPAFVW